MEKETKIGEGNEPVQNVVEEQTYTIAGVQTKVKYTDDNQILVETPDLPENEVDAWQKRAENEVKALKASNQKWSDAKKQSKENDETKAMLDKKAKDLESYEARLIERMNEFEQKISSNSKTKPENENGNLFGYKTKEELSDALVDNPEVVFGKMQSELNRNVEKQISRISMQTNIEREGYNFQEVRAFAKNLGTEVNQTVFDTYKQIHSKAKAKSQFDEINKIQESTITFVKGNSKGKVIDKEPEDIFSQMDRLNRTRDLNKLF